MDGDGTSYPRSSSHQMCYYCLKPYIVDERREGCIVCRQGTVTSEPASTPERQLKQQWMLCTMSVGECGCVCAHS